MSLFNLKNMSIQCIQAGADVGAAFGDDLYLTVNGKKFEIFNLSTGAPADDGGGFLPGQFGSALSGNGVTFGDNAIVSLTDKDDAIIDGPTGLFEGGDDFIGSTLIQPPSQNSFHFSFNIQGEGSNYHIEVDTSPNSLGGVVLKPRHPNGKVASKAGGVMNGSNTAGTLVGLGGKDIINANNGNDIVLGGDNNDILSGGNGNDILFGGKGKDILIGGAGADVFVIAPQTGQDKVKDFRDGDHIGLGGGLTYQSLSFVQQAKGTVVKAGSEKLAFLQGVSATQLTAADFTQVNLSDLNNSAKALLSDR